MRKLLAFVLAAVSCGIAHGQIEDAQARFERYQLDASHGLTDYLMVVSMYAEPAADSDLIFESNAQIRRTRTAGVTRQTWDSKLNIVAGSNIDTKSDDRVPGTIPVKSLGAFDEKRWETFESGGKTHIVYRGKDGSELPSFERGAPFGLSRILDDEPHDWPFVNGLHMGFQGGWSDRLLPLASKGKCVSAEERDGLLTAKFVKEYRKADWANAGVYLTFKDDQIVKVKHFVAGVKPDGTEYPEENYGEAATEWDTSGEFAVPKKVIAILSHCPLAETNEILLIANFKWYFPGSVEFEKEKEEVLAMQKLLPSRTFDNEHAGERDRK